VCASAGEKIDPFLLSVSEPRLHGCPAVSQLVRRIYCFRVQSVGCLVMCVVCLAVRVPALGISVIFVLFSRQVQTNDYVEKAVVSVLHFAS
jgi:hypothetical protein